MTRQSEARRGGYQRRALAAMGALSRALSYRPHVQIVPDKANIAVAAKAAYEHRVTVPVGAALLGFSATSSNPAGFTLNVLDAGTGASLASAAPDWRNITPQAGASVKDCLGQAHTAPVANRVLYLPKYSLITEPGVLRVQILNLAAAVNTIQLALRFALPPLPGDPRNEYNAMMEAELDLARRAARSPVEGQQTAGVITTQATITGGDVMAQPATNTPFMIQAADIPGRFVIVPGAGGYRVAIHQLNLYSAAKQTIRLLDGTEDLQGALPDYLGGMYLPYQQEEPHFVLQPGNSFQIDVAAGSGGDTGSVSGFCKFRMLEKWGQ